MQVLGENLCFGGRQLRLRFPSAQLGCETTVAVFLPPAAEQGPVPVVYWLSGLTCDDQNFTTKAGAQRVAARLGCALVAPDTSPRGEGVPDDPEGAWDFGLGAGFYVDATEAPWSSHYRMYSYVVEELPGLLAGEFAIDTSRAAITGHSMGGHGALTIALKNQERYRAAGAFSPICSPGTSPWGRKALTAYLGADEAAWKRYDATRLAQASVTLLPTLIEQGGADEFLAEQLQPEQFLTACAVAGHECEYRLHPGYDHSYYFIASFIEPHLEFLHSHL